MDVLLKLNTTVLAWPNKEPAVMVPLPLFVLPKSMVLLVAVLVPRPLLGLGLVPLMPGF